MTTTAGVRGRLVTVVVVGDHDATRGRTRRVLERHADLAVVGEADRGGAAAAAVLAAEPDVVVLDGAPPVGRAAEVARELTRRRPDTAVLVLSASADPDDVDAMLRAGVAGYLPGTARPEQLADAVRAVASGSAVLGRDVAGPPGGGLTAREVQVVALLAQGLTNQQIADDLRISRRTVEAHLQHVFGKCAARSRTGVVVYALRHGLVDPSGSGRTPGSADRAGGSWRRGGDLNPRTRFPKSTH